MAKETPKAPSPNQRVFRGQQQIMHDLYHLDVADCLKNQSYSEIPDYRKNAHVHWFHSVDNKGNPQNTTNSVGGHFHIIKPVGEAIDGEARQMECSPPMQWARSKTGVRKLVAVHFDDHTHDVVYVRSDKFVAQTVNPEAVKIQTMEAQKLAPIPGIQG